jgi:hypothetical protein
MLPADAIAAPFVDSLYVARQRLPELTGMEIAQTLHTAFL